MDNEYHGLKRYEYNQNSLGNIKNKYLSNIYLSDLFLNKTNLKNRNTFSNFSNNNKVKTINGKHSQFLRRNNQNKIYSSKTYINPFIAKVKMNKKFQYKQK